jgi:hypothetical protein
MQTHDRAPTPPKTTFDLDMIDGRISASTSGSSSSSFASPRTVLPSSLADFALAHSRSAPPSPSSPVMFMEDPIGMGLAGPGPFSSAGAFSQFRKLRRPSLLGLGGKAPTPATISAPQSPLANSSFGPILLDETRLRRGRSKSAVRPKTRSNHSDSTTPPQMALDSQPRSPSTPPSRPPPHRRTRSTGTPVSTPLLSIDSALISPQFKLPRLLSIQSELTNPADAELKSEASFQRLLASNADLPGALVRTPHPRRRDRGRFPEEYLDDEDAVESDDDDDELTSTAPAATNSNEALSTRGASSQGVDEYTMDDILDSPARMDIDMVSTALFLRFTDLTPC